MSTDFTLLNTIAFEYGISFFDFDNVITDDKDRVTSAHILTYKTPLKEYVERILKVRIAYNEDNDPLYSAYYE